MQSSTPVTQIQEPGSRKPDTATNAPLAPDQRQLAERYRAIGIAAVAAAVRYQGAPEP